MSNLKDKTIFITGSSRGIGREMALRFAKDGANIVIVAKSDKPHPKLEGTIHSVADEVEKAGGKALAIKLDVRDEIATAEAVNQAVETFGGIDVLINNASAISIGSTLDTAMKRYDLMMDVNVRATYACSQACIPHLKKSSNPHILTLSPPISLESKWFKNHLAYTLSKYGMSMCTLGMSHEFAEDGIAVNSLWPKTTIATAAISGNFPPEIFQASRQPSIVADAAYLILISDAKTNTGHFYIDEEVLRSNGQDDFSHYAVDSKVPLFTDLFLES